MKKLIVFLLFLICVNSAFAQPPTFQIFTQESTGLELEIPIGTFAVQNQGLQTNIHVFNSSDGILMKNDSVSCRLHLFNISGYHLAEEEMKFHVVGNDFFLNLTPSNFSEVGFRSFLINCNTSTYGGFIGGNFFVTVDGKENRNFNNFSFLIPILVLLFISILIVVGMIITKKQIVRVCYGLGLSFMVMALLRLSAWFIEITNSSENELIFALNFYWSISVKVFYFGVAGALIYLVVYTVASIMEWKNKKEKEGESEDFSLGKL